MADDVIVSPGNSLVWPRQVRSIKSLAVWIAAGAGIDCEDDQAGVVLNSCITQALQRQQDEGI